MLSVLVRVVSFSDEPNLQANLEGEVNSQSFLTRKPLEKLHISLGFLDKLLRAV